MLTAQVIEQGGEAQRKKTFVKKYNPRRNGFASHPFGWAQVKGGRVVKLSTAQRKPAGTGWGAVETSSTQIGDRAYLDGGTVYLR